MTAPLERGLLPAEDPLVIFGLATLVFLVAPLVLERYRLPGMIGIVVAGAAIGPNGVGLLARDATIVLLGQVGLVYLMFVAGLEIDVDRAIAAADRSVAFGLLSFVIPQSVGTAIGVWLLGLTLPAALLFAAVFASHTLLAYPVVSKLGVTNNDAVTAAIGGTVLTDTLALLVLAGVIASETGVIGAAFWLRLGVGILLLFAGIWIVVPVIARWFFRNLAEESYFEFLFVMVVLFAAAVFAHAAGIEGIVGAFLAGIALNRSIPDGGTLMNRIEFVGNALFIPFFLLSVGMLVDPAVVLGGSRTLVLGGSLIVMVLITKYAAAWLTGRLYDFSADEVAATFGLSVGQAAAALAIVLVAFEAGIPGFDRSMINAVVLMILAISLVSPIVVERAGREIVRAEARSPRAESETPRRVMLALSRTADYADRLLDLGIALRPARSAESLYAVTVVDSTGTDADVAAADASLDDVETSAAAAEVPIEARVRIANSPASGIAHAASENRITTIVVGWDGTRSRRQATFGSTIDQLLYGTTQQVAVAQLHEPLATTRRIVVLLPREIEYNTGISDTLRSLDRIASYVGGPVHAVTIGGNPTRVDDLFEDVGVPAPRSTERLDGWDAIRPYLQTSVDADDFVVCVSTRRGRPGWNAALRTLPSTVSETVSGNFAIVYPASTIEDDERRFLRFE